MPGPLAPTAPFRPRPEALRSCSRPPFWPRLLPLLAGLALLTRLPSFTQPLWNPDEGFLATQARILADGGVLYETVVDRKPPLLPWLYQACFALFGDQSLWPVRVLAMLAQLTTALLLASLARRRWGDAAGRAAAVLYLLVSIGLNPQDAQAAIFEVFMLPATVAAVWCADRGRWLGAGLSVAAALLTKQTGGAALLPVLCLLLRYAPERQDTARPPRSRAAARLAAGLALPLLAAALVTSPGRLLFWTVTGSGAYASVDGSVLLAAGRAAANAGLLSASCAGLLLPLLRRRPTGCPELWLWLAASALAVTTGFHFFGHYYLQLMPPLALLAAAALARLPRHARRPAYTLCALSCAAFLAWGFTARPAELAHTARVVAAVRERTGPADRVLIWGIHPEQYWLADRTPASRFLTAGLLTNYSGGRGPARVGARHAVPGSWPAFRRELSTAPPPLIVDDSRDKPYPPHRMPALRALLEARYERLGTADGAVLYELRQAR